MKEYLFVGVDQTGAVDANGVPKPLPGCILSGKVPRFFYLSSFSKSELIEHVKPPRNHKILVCVDCVLGLPEEITVGWREALARIENFHGYGRSVAKDFFFQLGQGQTPRRKIETACGANSVFQERPYQKNIQTGTYRIWKDISLNADHFIVPALETNSGEKRIKLFEGYPSLSWRLLLKSSKRDFKNLPQLLDSQRIEIDWSLELQRQVAIDPNLSDALLLALTIKKFLSHALKQKPSKEGWILGWSS